MAIFAGAPSGLSETPNPGSSSLKGQGESGSTSSSVNHRVRNPSTPRSTAALELYDEAAGQLHSPVEVPAGRTPPLAWETATLPHVYVELGNDDLGMEAHDPEESSFGYDPLGRALGGTQFQPH